MSAKAALVGSVAPLISKPVVKVRLALSVSTEPVSNMSWFAAPPLVAVVPLIRVTAPQVAPAS